MKCPKCGYTSFESYDACRKCSADLSSFKKTYGISALVLPPTVLAGAAVASASPQPTNLAAPADDNMFSFDLPDDKAAVVPAEPVVPFSFDDAPAAEHDPFAALLETTPEISKPAPTQQPVVPGSFELSNFSWDDTPPAEQSGTETTTGKSTDDDFESLFGDLTDPKK